MFRTRIHPKSAFVSDIFRSKRKSLLVLGAHTIRCFLAKVNSIVSGQNPTTALPPRETVFVCCVARFVLSSDARKAFFTGQNGLHRPHMRPEHFPQIVDCFSGTQFVDHKSVGQRTRGKLQNRTGGRESKAEKRHCQKNVSNSLLYFHLQFLCTTNFVGFRTLCPEFAELSQVSTQHLTPAYRMWMMAWDAPFLPWLKFSRAAFDKCHIRDKMKV